MKITFLGQSGFHIETQGKHLIIDPFITPNPKADTTAHPHIAPEQLPADYILLTHGHADHVADAEAIAKRTGATIISNYEIVMWYGKKGIQGHPLNHGGQASFDFGTVKYVNAVHSSEMPDGTYGGNPGGFVIWNDEGCFYHAGDTAVTMDMKLIPLTCPPLDFAILPVGDNFTMGPNDAALAAEFIGCKDIIGCHFDTFPYIEIDTSEATQVFHDKGLQLTLPKVGESMER